MLLSLKQIFLRGLVAVGKSHGFSRQDCPSENLAENLQSFLPQATELRVVDLACPNKRTGLIYAYYTKWNMAVNGCETFSVFCELILYSNRILKRTSYIIC